MGGKKGEKKKGGGGGGGGGGFPVPIKGGLSPLDLDEEKIGNYGFPHQRVRGPNDP